MIDDMMCWSASGALAPSALKGKNVCWPISAGAPAAAPPPVAAGDGVRRAEADV